MAKLIDRKLLGWVDSLRGSEAGGQSDRKKLASAFDLLNRFAKPTGSTFPDLDLPSSFVQAQGGERSYGTCTDDQDFLLTSRCHCSLLWSGNAIEKETRPYIDLTVAGNL
jgi:hypothetical protein